MLHSFKLKLFRSAYYQVHDDACTVKVCACAYGLNWRGLYPLARPWRARIIPMIYFLTGPEWGLYPFMDYFPCWHERYSKLTSKAANLSKWGALLSQNCFAMRSIEANRGRGQIFARKQGPSYALGK